MTIIGDEYSLLNNNIKEAKDIMLQQLKNMWGGITNKEKYIIDKSLNDVIERCLRCFRHINNKYYNKGENVIFSATHSC